MHKTPSNQRAADLFSQDKLLRIDKIRHDIAKRLRKACSHLSDVEFAVLVEKMILVQLEGETRAP